jgi:alkanesulfonate monooxygenase SsuD/methylene tetrahydromethanopterin reductase-like flavin-dependent oxidoreductase (luciferase family)
MLKPIIIMYPVIPARDEEERAALRPIGRNRERYQAAIQGMGEIIQAADNMGFWGAATPEHHFWSEGYEVAPSPGATNAYWLAKTKNIHIGPLGYVMSTQNPIRVAEEVAVIDHLSQGRTFVGFARGYQSRWTNTLGQHFGTRATKSPAAAVYNPQTTLAGFSQETMLAQDKADDAHNRRIFEDNVELVVKAWTQESFTHNGPAWQVPFPYEEGIVDWPLAHAGVTQKLGAPGEVDDQGVWRRASVAPAPYTRPHPKVFVAGSGSPETVELCGKHGFVPTYFASIGAAGPLSERYRTRAAQHGHVFAPGQNQALVRWIQIGKTAEDALEKIRTYDLDIWKNFYASMGRRKVEGNDIFGSLVNSGLFVFGTVDSVRQQLVEQWKVLPGEHIALVNHYAQMPKDAVIETLDIFQRQIKPALDEVIDHSYRVAAE